MSEASTTCQHVDIRIFDDLRCCLSCGEVVTDEVPLTGATLDHTEATRYQYKRLNYEVGHQIRLLHVHPGQGLDDIACDIVHVNLEDIPDYEAVSYTWATTTGDSSLSQVISCHQRTIAITKNCEAVLRCLRRKGRKRILWIDAICIDQSNNAERNHQVQLMAKIYSNALQVLAYLGARFPGRTAAKSVMSYLNGVLTGSMKTETPPNSHCLATFLQHPYFDRIWVLQEISLARLVILIEDDEAVHWTAHTIRKLIQMCGSADFDPPGALRWVPASQPEEHDFLDVMHRGRNCSATDPRDKVFALLGLVHRRFQDAIPVDYNLSPEQLFMKVAVYLITVHHRLDVLKHASNQPLDINKAPSWVPNWSVKNATDVLPAQFAQSQIHDLASYRVVSSPVGPCSGDVTSEDSMEEAVGVDQSLLQSEFAVCDRHINFGSASQDGGLLSDHIPTLHFLRIRAHRLDQIIRDNGPLNREGRKPVFDSYELMEQWDPFTRGRFCRSCSELNAYVPWDDRNLRISDFKRAASRFGTNAGVFVTEQSVGLVRGRMYAAGDAIWALNGLDVPLILREVDQHYVLIGECYLHRATMDHMCSSCGRKAYPWAMKTEIIDIW